MRSILFKTQPIDLLCPFPPLPLASSFLLHFYWKETQDDVKAWPLLKYTLTIRSLSVKYQAWPHISYFLHSHTDTLKEAKIVAIDTKSLKQKKNILDQLLVLHVFPFIYLFFFFFCYYYWESTPTNKKEEIMMAKNYSIGTSL